MNWEHRSELRADPARAPGERNIEVAAARRSSIWPSIAVAAAALAFGGVIWFAYQNGRESGHGGPPLIKAETGPVKIKPDNPGGQDIPFQDSTVYDRLGQGGQKPVVEKLLPPPESPVERPQAPPPSTPTVPQISGDPQLPAPPARTGPPVPDIGSPTALAPAPGAMIIAPPPVKTAPAVQKQPPAVAQKGAATPDPIAALIAGQPTVPPKPATAAAYRIRLSAVRSQDAVAPEWDRLKRHYPELANLKSAFSKTDQPGRGVFYRVEAGPLDAASAKTTCERLRTQGLGCIVVKP
jgi:hypothetical protein